MANTNPVLGVVIMARHGDRSGFYQDPTSYKTTSTAITPLGEQQCYQLGQLLRSRYGNETSETYVTGLETGDTLVPSQFNVTVDGGGEGGVISDSAVAMFQGWFPPKLEVSTMTLANGTNVTSPLNGYQYVQVNTVLPADDVDLESWVNCPTWTNQTNSFYSSPAFLQVEQENQEFLNSLKPLVGDRDVALKSMWNVYDYMNVQSIHNASFAQLLNQTGSDTLPRARDLANYHEWGSFTSAEPDGIGNIAARTFLPRVISSLEAFTQDSEVKVAHYHVSYKPFLSLFNLTAAAVENPDAIVDYASAVVFELRENAAGNGYDVRLGFKNGTVDSDFAYYPMFGSDSFDYDLDTFVSRLEPSLLPNTTTWCHACNNTVNSGCDVVALADNYKVLSDELASKSHFTPVGAGFIGVAVTLALGLGLIVLMRIMGWVSFGRDPARRKGGRSDDVALGKTDSVSSATPFYT
ncbi:hypothetical protein ACM66B_004120 [Microbotryomycetes sp. NB124-2]